MDAVGQQLLDKDHGQMLEISEEQQELDQNEESKDHPDVD
jgi:hypothetical protein